MQQVKGSISKPLLSAPLSDEQCTAYARNGYLVFDPEIPSSIIDGIISDLDGKYVDPLRTIDGVTYSAGRIQDAWKASSHVKAAALAPKVLAILEQLYRRKPLPFQTLNFSRGTEQAAHSDTIHFNSVPATYMCGVWLALEDMDMDVGPLVYYSGSHKLPEVTLDDLGVRIQFMVTPYYDWMIRLKRRLKPEPGPLPPTPSENIHESVYSKYYEPFIADLVATSGMKPSYGTIKKGQALLWAANLLHGGASRRDESRTRYSQVMHYFFEGCKYYTPLCERRTLTLSRKTFWRAPEWIR